MEMKLIYLLTKNLLITEMCVKIWMQNLHKIKMEENGGGGDFYINYELKIEGKIS